MIIVILILIYASMLLVFNLVLVKSRVINSVFKINLDNGCKIIKENKYSHKIMKSELIAKTVAADTILTTEYDVKSESGYYIRIFRKNLVRNRINYLIPFITIIDKKIVTEKVYDYPLSKFDLDNLKECDNYLKTILDEVYISYFNTVNKKINMDLEELLVYARVLKLNKYNKYN